MNRNHILNEAKQVVADRGESYGDARDSFERIAALWTYLLDVDVAPHQVASCMIAVKLARLSNDAGHIDSMIDIAGYAALWSECVEIGTDSLYDKDSHE